MTNHNRSHHPHSVPVFSTLCKPKTDKDKPTKQFQETQLFGLDDILRGFMGMGG